MMKNERQAFKILSNPITFPNMPSSQLEEKIYLSEISVPE